MLVTAFAQAVLKLLQLGTLRRLYLSLSARLSARFFRHLLDLPAGFYAQRFAGDVAYRSA